MRNLSFIITMFVFSFTTLLGQGPIAVKFVARSQTYQGMTIPYRLFIPDNYSAAKKYPLVLALHGSGQRGSDNLIQVQSTRMATSWADPVNQAKYPCFVVAPQCPLNQSWDYGNVMTISAILDSLAKEFTLDTNRLYVTGFSMGGIGTWQMISLFPNRFAAAIPICGTWYPGTASTIGNIPIWDFHGALDPTVPVTGSRAMIEALQSIGRTAVYTQCVKSNCSGIPDSTIAMYVKSHADLMYTEYKDAGHEIWDQSYDYPFLFPWVFDKYRLTPGAITITNIQPRRKLKGTETITWSSSRTADSVEIWYSPDAGKFWQLISAAEPNLGSYAWNTQNVNDCAFGLLKVCVKDHEGFVYGIDQSKYFSIDNAMNCMPFVMVLNAASSNTEVNYTLHVGDSDDSVLTLNISYKADGDCTLFHSEVFSVDSVSNHFAIDITKLPNSPSITIKLECTDGNSGYVIEFPPFGKMSPRSTLPPAQTNFISKNTDAPINFNIVEASKTTNHSYRISFCDTSMNAGKTFSVFDITEGRGLFDQKPFSPFTEADPFEGLSLYAEDIVTSLNYMQWKTISGLAFDASFWAEDIQALGLRAYRHACDYKIVFYDHIVDTTLDYYDAVPVPVKFKVFNITQRTSVKVAADFTVGIYLYFFEPVEKKEQYTWSTFIPPKNGKMPDASDTLYVFMKKGISIYDTIIVKNIPLVVKNLPLPLPHSYELFHNYPNPFNPSTMIGYQLPVKSKVSLKIFDLLGREVATLVNEEQSAGWKEVQWNAKDVASGIYFYRIEAGSFMETKKMILMR